MRGAMTCDCCGKDVCGHKNTEPVNEALMEVVRCLDCGKAFRKPDVYSRVVGYLRPVRQWNNGKKQEFLERKTYLT